MDKRYPSGILASCVIPWREDYTLDEELFRREIALTVAQTPLTYIMGTAGEGYAVGENYFPEELKGKRYYHPVARGLEIKIAEKLEHLRELDKVAARADK